MARRDALLRLHKTLLGRRTELRKRLGLEFAELGHARGSSPSGDSADAAFDAGSEEMASQLAEMESRELNQIEQALRKLRQGTYGTCEGCAVRIPVLRLNALPYSVLCIKCQRQAELDSSWLEGRAGANWDKVAETEAADEPREVDLSELEMDITK